VTDDAVLLRRLPSVQRLLDTQAAIALAVRHGRGTTVKAIRVRLDALRAEIAAGAIDVVPEADAIVEAVGETLVAASRPRLRRVINATGILLHTNLGRAPLAREAIDAVAEVARGYANLEFDLASGARGSRTAGIEPLLARLTGASAALAVNNGAAAILLALSALAQDGEVIVSRGELVEIGGGFRIPDVIVQGGARLVEVGATNRTRLADYRAAITPATRVLLKVHQSNFRSIGFVAETGITELSALAREHGLLVVVDLGSGLLTRLPTADEPSIAEALDAGADLVTCSGDKLLGGPQAGLIVGTGGAVDPLRRHPLLRAVRLDKMSLAALETTLMLHRDAPGRVPVLAMLAQSGAAIAARATRLRDQLGRGEIVATTGFAGGGALPEQRVASHALALASADRVDGLAARLRTGDPAIVGRIAEGRLLIDLLAVADTDLDDLATAIAAALG
jgi:L-seryl-tRNA(Ser) seleniumtransferase